jgi:hypothetical protein
MPPTPVAAGVVAASSDADALQSEAPVRSVALGSLTRRAYRDVSSLNVVFSRLPLQCGIMIIFAILWLLDTVNTEAK